MSEASQVTPGVWRAWRSPNGLWTVRAVYHDEQDRRTTAFVATVECGIQNNEANANLMAASPDLLSALDLCREVIRYLPTTGTDDVALAQIAADVAIAKARGEA